MNKSNNPQRKLFAFDMDGTLLMDSQNAIVSPSVKKTIANLMKHGHIVCLFTGRPWRATKKIYEELNLDTIVVNYNGAYIHHPKKYEFIPIIESMPISYVMRITNSSQVKKIAKNIAIEGPQYIHLQKNEKSNFTNTFIKVDDDSIITSPINFCQMLARPTGVLVEIKPQYAKSIHEISNYFKSRFGDLVSFSYWETGAGDNPILEFTNSKAKKDIALIRVARYYKISMSNTVAFGDGFNDVDMLKMAGVGVAMQNASEIVKSYANVISRHSNKNDGIAKFIEWYFKGGSKKVDRTIYSLGGSKPKVAQVVESK